MIGIYALWFEESSMIYIGQSQNIKARYREHLYKLKNDRHTNYKVIECYTKYGLPELVVLEECLIDQLNELEIIWTAEFDSIKNGLNIIEAGQVGHGTNSNSSKYSRMQILKVFSLLYKTDLSYIDIALKTGVPWYITADIKQTKNHLWLKEEYPVKYKQMINRTGYKNLGGVLTKFIKPNGTIIEINSIKGYARDNHFDNWKTFSVGLSRLRSKARKSYKGWKLYKEK